MDDIAQLLKQMVYRRQVAENHAEPMRSICLGLLDLQTLRLQAMHDEGQEDEKD